VKPIQRRDILGPRLYGPVRDDFRKAILQRKKPRRIDVGDRVTLVFENRDTLRFQIEEMLRAESIVDDAKIQDEIDVYNSMLPTPSELSATLFLNILPDENARESLHRFIGIDEHVSLIIGETAVRARFEPGRQEEDRISAVQYIRYPIDPAARAALRTPGTPLAIEIDHPNYRQRVALGEDTRASLGSDLDED
jgi:hypothetical protein